MIEFLLGLPYLADNELLATARRLDAAILLSANALSRWKTTRAGVREWDGFDLAPLRHVGGLRLHLDSAGFVAANHYGEFPWSVRDYIGLAAAHPWEWFASMDWCVEREVAPDDESVLNRISGTVRLNLECRIEADRRGIGDRLMPVIQGWSADQYIRCIDRMGFLLNGVRVIGVGSMCRRQVHGEFGILRVVDAIDRALGSNPAKLHLFGLKSAGAAQLSGHPRVQSVDSQAYGTAARWEAIDKRETDPAFSCSNAFTAEVMERWYRTQRERMVTRRYRPAAIPMTLDLRAPVNDFADRMAASWERLRQLHEEGELDFGHVCSRWAFEGAYDDME